MVKKKHVMTLGNFAGFKMHVKARCKDIITKVTKHSCQHFFFLNVF